VTAPSHPGTGTERYDTSTGGAAADFAMALYTTTVAAAASTSMDVTMGVSDSNQALSGIWLALKGPDAQDFTAVQLDEWTFHSARSTTKPCSATSKPALPV
jgi:hypothetical protein